MPTTSKANGGIWILLWKLETGATDGGSFSSSGRNQIEVVYIQPLTAFEFQMISNAKIRFLSDITQCLSLEITQMCDFSFFFCRSTINHRAR